MVINRTKAFCITFEMIDAGLKGNELIIYAYLDWKCYNVQGWYKEGIIQICRDLKLSEPTVINIIKKLISYDVLEKDYYFDENKIRKCMLRTI